MIGLDYLNCFPYSCVCSSRSTCFKTFIVQIWPHVIQRRKECYQQKQNKVNQSINCSINSEWMVATCHVFGLSVKLTNTKLELAHQLKNFFSINLEFTCSKSSPANLDQGLAFKVHIPHQKNKYYSFIYIMSHQCFPISFYKMYSYQKCFTAVSMVSSYEDCHINVDNVPLRQRPGMQYASESALLLYTFYWWTF